MYHHFLTVAQFRAEYGPKQSDLESVAHILKGDGFKTTVTSQGVVADAPQAVVERTFHVRLRARPKSSHMEGIALMEADRAPTVPPALSALHAQIAAYAPVPLARPNYKMLQDAPIKPQNRFGADEPFYWFDDLKQAYTYPSYTTFNGGGRRAYGCRPRCERFPQQRRRGVLWK